LGSDEVIMMADTLTDKLLGSPVIELANDSDSIDTYSLCASKHEAWIYVTDEDGSGVPNAVDDSIIVAFSGTDTSGAGCIDAIFEGSIVFLTDPKEWRDTISEGYDVLNQRRKDCSGVGDCVSDYAQWGVYSGIAGVTTAGSYVVSGVGAVGGWIKDIGDDDDWCYITTAVMRAEGHDNSPELNSMRRLRDSWVVWQAPGEVGEYYRTAPSIVKGIDRRADSDGIYRRLYRKYILPAHTQVSNGNLGSAHRIYRAMVDETRQYASDSVTVCNPRKGEDGEFWGTTFHNQNGGEHKVKITINKLYQGKTTTVYQSELAGGDGYKKADGKLLFEPSFRKFKLTGPGLYTINVKSLAANMDCGNPSLDLTTTVEVAAAPADPDGDTDGTVETLNEGVSGISEATGVRPLYLYGGIVLVGGLLVSRYLDLFTGGRSE
jgi:hypothetical protein